MQRLQGRTDAAKTASATKLQKAVDASESPPYMALHSNGDGPISGRRRFAPLLGRYNRCPEPIEPGEEARRLFDIVGLDEGTCGRRPGLPEPLGSG